MLEGRVSWFYLEGGLGGCGAAFRRGLSWGRLEIFLRPSRRTRTRGQFLHFSGELEVSLCHRGDALEAILLTQPCLRACRRNQERGLPREARLSLRHFPARRTICTSGLRQSPNQFQIRKLHAKFRM